MPAAPRSALSQLFTPGTDFWMIAGNAAQTVFDAGTLEQQAAGRRGDARRRSVAQYRSAVLTAFQNVADMLRALQADYPRGQRGGRGGAVGGAQHRARPQAGRARAGQHLGAAHRAAGLSADLAGARAGARPSRLADTVALFQALGGGWWNRSLPQRSGQPTRWTRCATDDTDALRPVHSAAGGASRSRRLLGACAGAVCAGGLADAGVAAAAAEGRRQRSGHGRPDAPARASSRCEPLCVSRAQDRDRPDRLQRGRQHGGADAVLRPRDAADRQDRRRGEARRSAVRDRQPGGGAGADRPDRRGAGARQGKSQLTLAKRVLDRQSRPARRQGHLAARGRAGAQRSCGAETDLSDRGGDADGRAQPPARDRRPQRGGGRARRAGAARSTR